MEKSQKKLPATSPNFSGERCSSAVNGTATRPSTILSRKLMRASPVSRRVIVHADFAWKSGEAVIGCLLSSFSWRASLSRPVMRTL